MKRFFALMVLLVLMLTGCGSMLPGHLDQLPSSEPVQLATPVRITVVGDSYSAGTSLGGQRGAGWPALVFADLAKNPALMVTGELAAEGGAGYAKTGNYEHTLLQKATGVVGPNDNLVVVFGGRNDSDLPLDLVQAAIHETLGQLHSVAINAKVLVVGPAWPGNPPPEVFAVRDIIRDEATAANIQATFIDPLEDHWLEDPGLMTPDGIHPNDEGHKYIAQKLEPVMQSLLAPAVTKVS